MIAAGGGGFVFRDRRLDWRGVAVALSLRPWLPPMTVAKGLSESAGLSFPADSDSVCRDPGSLAPGPRAAEFCATEEALCMTPVVVIPAGSI